MLKESYENLDFSLIKMKCQEFKWPICADFKILTTLLRQQVGCTKLPCFLCGWNNRSKKQQWIKKEWPLRKILTQDQVL